jgi:hypothetical protein
MLHSYRSVPAVSCRPDLQVYIRRWSQKPVPRALTLSPVKARQAHWILLMYKLHMLFQPQPLACYFMHDMILLLRDKLLWPPNLRTLSQLIFILLDIFVTNDLRKGVSFQKKMFSKWVWWRVVTLITFERDDQGLPGLGEGLRWWLSWVRCEHEGSSLSPKDRFVITPYLYSYQVQSLKTVWAVAWSNFHGPNPRIMTAGEHREDKEGGCFV